MHAAAPAATPSQACPVFRGLECSTPATARRLGAVLVTSLAITVVQLLVACSCSGAGNAREAYRSLSQWDSKWYARIADRCYADAVPADELGKSPVGFFPGYPLLARAVAQVTGLATPDALLVTAQLACWAFWAYVLLFLRRWRVPSRLAAAGAVAVAVHPCAFFLVAGYSESLFLAGALGFLYWSSARGPLARSLAALHGIVMTGTRIVGLPLVICPVIVALVPLPQREATGTVRSLVSAGSLAFTAALGGLLFFGFCQLRLGHWDLYLQIQRVGWGVRPDYLAFLRPGIYMPVMPAIAHGDVNPNDLSRLCVPLTALALAVLAALECWRARSATGFREQRLGQYLAAAILFYLAVAGLANSGMISMVRYTFCVHVLLVLAAVSWLASRPLTWGTPQRVAVYAFLLTAIASATFEIMLARRFTHGEWVA
jgi:hypothetical protein